jgi:hypothetical protein
MEHHVEWYSALLMLVLGGYLFFDRAFAHLHIPGTPIYVAESVLALGLVLVAYSRQARRFLTLSTPMRALMAFMAWGLILAFFHIFEHGLDAVQDSALWYYGLFAIVVAVVVRTLPHSLERFIPVYAAALGAWALLGWVRLALSGIEASNLPTTHVVLWSASRFVPWTSHLPGNIAIHAAIGFAFTVLILGPWLAERLDRPAAGALTAIPAVALLILCLGAGTQSRAGLVSGLLVIVGVPLVSRKIGPAIAIVSLVVVVILGALYVTDVSVDLGADRDLSVRQLIENIVTVRAGEDSGRIDFWSPVLDDILTQEHALTGLGFGENLGERYKFLFDEGIEATDADVNPLRNVHNSQLNVLARMGVIGLGLWIAVWGLWYFHLFRARARLRLVDSPRRAAYLGWAMLAALAIHLNSLFDGTLEAPQIGLWLWAIFGLGAAVALDINLREWQRRRAGAGEIIREGRGTE